MVRQYLVIDGVEVDILELHYDPTFMKKRRTAARILLDSTYDEIKELFKDNIDWSYVVETETDDDTLSETTDMNEYKVLTQIVEKNGKFEVTMSKLSDLEKLIELHYGGVN